MRIISGNKLLFVIFLIATERVVCPTIPAMSSEASSENPPVSTPIVDNSEENGSSNQKAGGLPTAQLTKVESELLGTWGRGSFLWYGKLAIMPDRSYRQEYVIPKGGKSINGRWRVENESELVLETRQDHEEIASTTRMRIVNLSQKELKLASHLPTGRRKTFTYNRITAAKPVQQKSERCTAPEERTPHVQ